MSNTNTTTEEMRALVDSLAEAAIIKFYQSRAEEQQTNKTTATTTTTTTTTTKQKKKKKKKSTIKAMSSASLSFGDVTKFNTDSWCSTYAHNYLKESSTPTPRTLGGKIHCWTDTGRVDLKVIAQIDEAES